MAVSEMNNITLLLAGRRQHAFGDRVTGGGFGHADCPYSGCAAKRIAASTLATISLVPTRRPLRYFWPQGQG